MTKKEDTLEWLSFGRKGDMIRYTILIHSRPWQRRENMVIPPVYFGRGTFVSPRCLFYWCHRIKPDTKFHRDFDLDGKTEFVVSTNYSRIVIRFDMFVCVYVGNNHLIIVYNWTKIEVQFCRRFHLLKDQIY